LTAADDFGAQLKISSGPCPVGSSVTLAGAAGEFPPTYSQKQEEESPHPPLQGGEKDKKSEKIIRSAR
jgi:hypothetical protein